MAVVFVRNSGRLHAGSCEAAFAGAGLPAIRESGVRVEPSHWWPYTVHLRCAWIDITTPKPVNRVIAEVPP